MSASKFVPWSFVGLGSVVMCLWLQAFVAGAQPPDELSPNEVVQTVHVEITIGADGEALNETVAMDLGLGFPFWLAPVGETTGSLRGFGAMPRVGAANSIAPGATASFEFSANTDSGLDPLLTSPQLLSNVQVGDISRIGFASRGESGWVLAGYKVTVNGKILAERENVDSDAIEQRRAAEQRKDELTAEIASRQAEVVDLESLITAGCGTEADQQHLKELQIELAPQLTEQRQLDRQLLGSAPWYTDGDFHPAWETDSVISSMKVTVVTAPHTGADSRNFVYFQTGGHKYLLGSPSLPLTPTYGPQEFLLDIAVSPLRASDIRGFGLGMIANDLPQGDAPDRWHPERFIVEVDDRVVYDSEENSLDSSSLSAIRLIPPAHRNASGQIVSNSPIARETFLWESGKGQGIDLVNGGAEELPPAGASDAPAAEPGLTIDTFDTVVVDEGGWYDPWAGPFPGEADYGPGWMPAPPWAPRPPWAPGWGPGWIPGWVPGSGMFGPSWQDLLALAILEELGLLPDWVIPPPVGDPPQIEHVSINNGIDCFDWDVVGNVGQIDHFVAEIFLIRPDLMNPMHASVSQPLILPATARSVNMGDFILNPLMPTFDEASRNYFAVRVTLVPTDPAIGCDIALSPAFPHIATEISTNFNVSPLFHYEPVGSPPFDVPLSLGGEPGLFPFSVWLDGQTDSHNGLVFAGFSPFQHHIVARPAHNGDHMTVELRADLEGKFRLIAFAGFLGGLEIPGTCQIDVNCTVYELANPANHLSYPATALVSSDPNVAPTPLVPIIIDIDTLGDIGPGHMGLTVTYHVNCIAVDPAHPPVLTGIRLLHAP